MPHETSLAELFAYLIYMASWICAVFAANFWWQSAKTPPLLAGMTDPDIAMFNESLKQSADKNRKAALLTLFSAALTNVAQPFAWHYQSRFRRQQAGP